MICSTHCRHFWCCCLKAMHFEFCVIVSTVSKELVRILTGIYTIFLSFIIVISYRFPCFLWLKTKIYTELYYSVSLNISTKSNKLTSRKSPGANGIIACRFGSEEIDFHALLNHFKSVQQNHLDLLRAQSQEQQLTRGVKILDLSDSEESDDREDSETNKYSL